MLKLGVNVDHVATVRQARLADKPNPEEAALLAEQGGAIGITAHLREDRRHINDRDMSNLKKSVKNLNMEMAVTDETIRIALELKPHSCCLVPEKRQELTTEGGLDIIGARARVAQAIDQLHGAGILVSCFIDPEEAQIRMASELKSDYIELHTGSYANSSGLTQKNELERLKKGAELAYSLGLKVNAGHGIDYWNIGGILEIKHLSELNIGHSIVARAVMVGMEKATREMADLMKEYQD